MAPKQKKNYATNHSRDKGEQMLKWFDLQVSPNYTS